MTSSIKTLDLLRNFESRNITFLDPDGSWPIVWDRAKGVHVWDVEGRRYLDLTAAFGVAATGHGNPAVVRAGQRQMARLLHAMGDVHPHALKAQLARELSRITFERWSSPRAPGHGRQENRLTGKTIFGNSGFEAVEAALKTALLATGKSGIIVFDGAYHGLGYGTLNATHRDHFWQPFHAQLPRFGCFAPYPKDRLALTGLESSLRRIFRRRKIGAILVEPVQGRGGIRVPPPQFLPLLRQLADEQGAVLIADEVFTGFGRTGAWFACEHSRTIPDLLCLGKALTGGFPLSACVGRAALMDAAWPPSNGEAIHTSTFLGHPVGCAMALAQIQELESRRLIERSAHCGQFLLEQLVALAQSDSTANGRDSDRAGRAVSPPLPARLQARGAGLMAGLELRDRHGGPATTLAMQIIKQMLRRGFILLPEGEHSNVISFTPPLTITRAQLGECLVELRKVLERLM